jgi:ubiquinone/menaquinone biosynthesis C-methylase UbiE
MTTTGEHAESAYLLGHSPTELDRLVLQARLYDPITTHALRLAGLSSGMRVLDVGCGAGDVTFAAAAIVGPTGAVTGIDAAPAALESARARAARRGAETGGEGESAISFREAILPDVTLEEPVDAVIGRLILGHLPDPVTALRRLSRLVRPGGIIAFQDFDNHPLRVVPATPLTGAVLQTIAEALTVDGTDLGAGARLYSLFREAGLPPSSISATTPTGGAEGRRHELLARTHAFGDRRGPVPVGVEEGRVVCGVVGEEAKGASW